MIWEKSWRPACGSDTLPGMADVTKERGTAAPMLRVFHREPAPGLGGVTESGFLDRSRGVGSDRVLGRYAVVLLLDGAGQYRDAWGYKSRLRSGGLILVSPRLAHRYGPDEGQVWTERYLCFEGPLFDLFFSQGGSNLRPPVRHVEPVEVWRRKLDAIITQPGPVTAAEAMRENLRLMSFLLDLQGLAPGRGGLVRGEDWMTRACALIETAPTGPLDLRDLARRLGTNYETFRKTFAGSMGMSPTRYRALRQIETACAWMEEGGRSDKEIAEALGFCDGFHFSKRFKQLTGMSPRAFRLKLASR